MNENDLTPLLLQLRDQLRTSSHRLVLVESCTAGLVAALLGQIPGISEFLCGSMVVYQTPIKHEWLGIESNLLTDPEIGPVSSIVTEKLVLAILDRTPQATIACAITGHLGPFAPINMDGLVYCATALRNGNLLSQKFKLTQAAPANSDDLLQRRNRQFEAADLLIRQTIEFLSGSINAS